MHIINLDPNYKPAQFAFLGHRYELSYEKFNFSAGEAHIKLKGKDDFFDVERPIISHRLNSSNDIMEVLLAADALRRKHGNIPIDGYFPYLPYGRQDRPMIVGEPFSLKVFANLMATANFRKIYTLDPHSDVTAALFDNIVSIPPVYLKSAKEDIEKNYGDFILCSPDGGALKKIYKEAKLIDYKGDLVYAQKVRDVSSGKILKTEVSLTSTLITDKTVWIMDDICDGGRTFIELARVLKEDFDAKHVVLSVSHAMISHGEEELKKYIDKIYTTNSIKDEESELIKRYPI